MAIYYKRNANPTNTNWNQNDNWSTVSSASAVNAGTFPVAADTAIFDAASLTCTVNVASACAVLTMTGYNTNLVMNADLTVSGTCTLPSGASGALTGTSTLILSTATQSLVTNSKAIPALTFSIAGTKTITGTSTITGLLTTTGTTVFNGGGFTVTGGMTIGGNLSGTTTMALNGGTFTGAFVVTNTTTYSTATAITIASSMTLPNLVHSTGYTGTFTINNGVTLNIAGNVNLNASATYVAGGSTAGLRLTGASTITPNGLTLPYNFSSTGAGTKTLAANLTLGSGKSFEVLTNNCAFNGFRLYMSGTFTTGTNISGTTVFEFNTGATLNTGIGIITAPIVFNGDVTWAGSVRFGTGANITYTSGTINATSGTLGISQTSVTLTGWSTNINIGTIGIYVNATGAVNCLTDIYCGSIVSFSNPCILSLNSATNKVYVSGSLPTTLTTTLGGTATIVMNGTGTWNWISMSVVQAVEINTAGTISLGNMNVRKSFKYIAGSITDLGAEIYLNPPATLDLDTLPIRVGVRFNSTGVMTLASNLNCTTFGKLTTSQYTSMSVVGGFNIDCNNFVVVGNGDTLTLQSGQTMTVNTMIRISGTTFLTPYTGTTINASTPGVQTSIAYLGTPENSKVAYALLTDIDAFPSPMPIYTMYGSVSNCLNAYAATVEDIGSAGATLTII